jgi:tetratricopeptide (TPR) repeat protein
MEDCRRLLPDLVLSGVGVSLFFVCCFLSSCGTKPHIKEVPLTAAVPAVPDSQPPPRAAVGGVAEEIRSLVESGSFPSLLTALDLVRDRNLEESDFGRLMNAVAVTLLQKVYPSLQNQYPGTAPPQSHAYTRILREAERGNYVSAPQNSRDYLEHVLPFLALLRETRPEKLDAARADLLRAGELNKHSVLAPFFLGLIYERSGLLNAAEEEFNRAYALSSYCYPAAIGLARIMESRDKRQEAIRLLSDLLIQYPDNLVIKRQLAITYYNDKDWSRADPVIAEVLQRDSRNSAFILMRAHVLVEQGQFLQAQAPLDLLGSIDPNNRLYLFLRARVQAEGYRNRDSALNYLRSILRTYPNDDEASVYAARLLLESGRSEDRTEGRELLTRLMSAEDPSLLVVNLALQDAIYREAWSEARPYLDRLLAERRSAQDLLSAYRVERGLGNNSAALQAARELYERNTSAEEGINAYITALIDTGRNDEAGRLIESRIASLSGGALKGRYYYLRSRLRTNEEAAMNDLRSSLFEDPRNINALIAMFEIYHRRKDDSRAVFYLKQALALAPDNPQLKRYASEYSSSLGGGY